MNTPTTTEGARPNRPARRQAGFTLLEILVTMMIVALLAALAVPSYRSMQQRGSRETAKAQLVALAGLQEKIFLNSNAYTASVTAAYDGSSTGGLGVPNGLTTDGRYTLTVTVADMSFTLTATPVSTSTQAGDGVLTIDSRGRRTWGAGTW